MLELNPFTRILIKYGSIQEPKTLRAMADGLAISIELESIVNNKQSRIAMVHNSWADCQKFTSFWHLLAYLLILLPKPTASFNVKELYFVKLIQNNMQRFFRRNPSIKDPSRQTKQSNFALAMARCNRDYPHE